MYFEGHEGRTINWLQFGIMIMFDFDILATLVPLKRMINGYRIAM